MNVATHKSYANQKCIHYLVKLLYGLPQIRILYSFNNEQSSGQICGEKKRANILARSHRTTPEENAKLAHFLQTAPITFDCFHFDSNNQTRPHRNKK